MQSDNASQQDGNIAIVVGRGQLPGELVAGLMAKGRSPVLVGIEGETEPWLENFEHKIFAWGQLGAFFKHLKQSGVECFVCYLAEGHACAVGNKKRISCCRGVNETNYFM